MNLRNFVRRLGLAAVLPLVLGLAACGKGGESDTAGLSGEPIAAIAPPAGKLWTETVNISPDGGYVMGNPDAPIKVIEYGSLTCPHCAEFAETSGVELRDQFIASGRVSYEFRNVIRDGIDLTLAQMVRCGAPESFFALTDQVFANQKSFFETAQNAGKDQQDSAFKAAPAQRGMAIANLIGAPDFFAARGVGKDQLGKCLADSAAAEKLATLSNEQGQKYGIEGTPTFFINGKKEDFNTWPLLKDALMKAGAR
ncbi:thioredoxin domain-containing protein [Novosphingobium sp.]|uniref:thioredoxin domain-containing protein n=1 Tax=Novosphingobium sp. TaxID=1874826 RepID=UPI0035B48073